MVGWHKSSVDDTDESYRARGKQHLVILDSDEGGEDLRNAQPELDWLDTTWPGLPYQEFLLVALSGAVSAAEATDIVWVTAAPTLKNITEIWANIIMHMTAGQGALSARAASASTRPHF